MFPLREFFHESQQAQLMQSIAFQQYLREKEQAEQASSVGMSQIRTNDDERVLLGQEQGDDDDLNLDSAQDFSTAEDQSAPHSATARDTDIEFDKELFIEEVRKFRCLWDLNSSCFKDRQMKRNAWAQIGQILNKEDQLIKASFNIFTRHSILMLQQKLGGCNKKMPGGSSEN